METNEIIAYIIQGVFMFGLIWTMFFLMKEKNNFFWGIIVGWITVIVAMLIGIAFGVPICECVG